MNSISTRTRSRTRVAAAVTTTQPIEVNTTQPIEVNIRRRRMTLVDCLISSVCQERRVNSTVTATAPTAAILVTATSHHPTTTASFPASPALAAARIALRRRTVPHPHPWCGDGNQEGEQRDAPGHEEWKAWVGAVNARRLGAGPELQPGERGDELRELLHRRERPEAFSVPERERERESGRAGERESGRERAGEKEREREIRRERAGERERERESGRERSGERGTGDRGMGWSV